MKKLLSILALLLCLPFLLPNQVLAAEELPDPSRTGSITIQFDDDYKLQGSEYAIWHVADIKSVDGPYKYVNTEEFKDVHFKWTNEDLDYWDTVDSAPLIGFVEEYVEENNIPPYKTATIGSSNQVTFGNLPLGIYLVKQTKVGPDGYVVTSYLATIPDPDGNYDVSSNAKTDPYKKPEEPKNPTKKDPNTNTAAAMMKENFLLASGLSLTGLAFVLLLRKQNKSSN